MRETTSALDVAEALYRDLRDRVAMHSASLRDFREMLQLITRVQPDEIYNLGAQIGDRALKDTSLKAFETHVTLARPGLLDTASEHDRCLLIIRLAIKNGTEAVSRAVKVSTLPQSQPDIKVVNGIARVTFQSFTKVVERFRLIAT